MMQTYELLQNLLTQKYIEPIVLEDNYKINKSAVLMDSSNGTLFSTSGDFLFFFKDKNENCWSTIPKSLIINGKEYFPSLGDSISKRKGITHYFTTKEAVIEMAFNYFKQFKNPNYGIEKITSYMYFLENCDDRADKYFVVFQKFRSRIHTQIEAYISSN